MSFLIRSLMDPMWIAGFRAHDLVSAFLSRRLIWIKRTMLMVAHASLFGFFFPELRRDFGEMAANVLVVILFLSPLAKISGARFLTQLMGLRREMGIAMGYLATVHGLGYLLDREWFALVIAPVWPDIFSILPAMLWGMIAYTLTLPLLLTSNTFATRWLGGIRWKRLHRLAYVLFVAVLIHRFLVRGGDARAFAEMSLLGGTYVFLKLLAWKNFLPPLAHAIDSIAGKYREYQGQRRNGPAG